jgi:two-component system NarL family sensor kinase
MPGRLFYVILLVFLQVLTALADTRTDSLKQLCGRVSLKNFDQMISVARLGVAHSLEQRDSVAFAFFTRYMGMAYYFKGDYRSASPLYFKAIGVLERHADKPELAAAYNELAKLYRKTRKLDQAERTYDKAMHIYEALQDSGSISMILNESGVVFEYAGNYREALRRYNGSLGISERRGDTVGMAYALNNISGVYSLQKDYGMAEAFLKKALVYRKQLKDSFALAINYSDLGANYYAWGKFRQALLYLDSSLVVARRLKYLELQSANYLYLAKTSEAMADPARAYAFFKNHVQLKDSIFTVQSEQQLNELNTKYETGKKDLELVKQKAEIVSREKQNFIKNGIIAAILVTGLLLFLLTRSQYKRRRLRQQAELDAELNRQKELRIKSVLEAEEKERRRIAQDLHDGVGQILSAARLNLSSLSSRLRLDNPPERDALKNAMDLLDDSVKEVRAVSHNMMPNTLLKLGLVSAVREFITKIQNMPDLRVSLEIVGMTDRLEPETESILYRVIQEVVANIIKHARATELSLQLIRHEKELTILIEDNGVGFDTNRINDFEGIGLKNIVSRVEFLNGTVHFDSTPGRGTSVVIEIAL